MALTGIVLGLLSAFLIQGLFGKIRSRWPKPFAVLGWIAAVFAVFVAVLWMLASFSMRHDPHPDLGPMWGMFGVMLIVFLMICGGIGAVHRRRFSIGWGLAFGLIMCEASAAIAVGFLFWNSLYSIADIIRGSNDSIDAIFAADAQARVLLGYMDETLFFALLVLISCAGLKIGPWRKRFGPGSLPSEIAETPQP